MDMRRQLKYKSQGRGLSPRMGEKYTRPKLRQIQRTGRTEGLPTPRDEPSWPEKESTESLKSKFRNPKEGPVPSESYFKES